jgi:hypothetical protein
VTQGSSKSQIPGTKSQASSKVQIAKGKTGPDSFGYWGFGSWKLLGAWDLGFGVSD